MTTDTTSYTTFADLMENAETHLKEDSDRCPFCFESDYRTGEWEFGHDSAWVRYECCVCDCHFALIYRANQPVDYDVHDHHEHNRVAFAAHEAST